jgi:hypothetical protein
MSKQTAVEWLVSKLSITFQTMYSEEIEQAKAMEKEQIIEFTNKYLRQIYEVGEMTIEEFYNETYGGDK